MMSGCRAYGLPGIHGESLSCGHPAGHRGKHRDFDAERNFDDDNTTDYRPAPSGTTGERAREVFVAGNLWTQTDAGATGEGSGDEH